MPALSEHTPIYVHNTVYIIIEIIKFHSILVESDVGSPSASSHPNAPKN